MGRQWVWKSFCRGHNPILMEHLPPQSMVLSNCPLTPDDPGYIASREAMGHTRRFAERMNLAAMTPSKHLASSGYCLANPGKEYLVYLPEGGEVTVDLSAASGPITVQWLNPVEGTVARGEPVGGGAERAFGAPFGGEAVLYLRSRNSQREGEKEHETWHFGPFTRVDTIPDRHLVGSGQQWPFLLPRGEA